MLQPGFGKVVTRFACRHIGWRRNIDPSSNKQCPVSFSCLKSCARVEGWHLWVRR